MENYTKYKLKSSDELASVLNGKDNLFVIACNKCFKEFETVEEPDCDEFLKFAKEQGKTVTGSAKVDFLCNKMHTERKLQDLLPEGTENVVVISCGLGIQTVADLAGKPVVAASNTLNYRGHHGMALTKKSCDACAPVSYTHLDVYKRQPVCSAILAWLQRCSRAFIMRA